MKILLTSPSMQAGGAEQVVTMLAAGLASRGHSVGLAAPAGVRDRDLLDVPHARLPLDDHGRAVTGAARTATQLASAVRRFSPDIIHAQNVKASVTARAAALASFPRKRPAVLATFHGVLPVEYRRAARLLRAADHTACVSSDLRRNIVEAGLRERRTSLVRNAITPSTPLSQAVRAELDTELGLAGAPVVAVVGRLVPQKAHERFVLAARHVSERLPAARFLIVGEGPRRGEIEDLVAVAGLTEQVRFTGMRPDARQIIARANLLVFSSDWEGLSIAALEALAAGTPVVSTDVQGMRELLVDSASGTVVSIDDGRALGERVLQLLHDEPALNAMGDAGKRLIAEEYSVETMIETYEDLYERLGAPESGRCVASYRRLSPSADPSRHRDPGTRP
jgi:glycosyltransferase involved in cell wall biosynthesis